MVIQDVLKIRMDILLATKIFDIVLSPTTTSLFSVHLSHLENFGVNITRNNYIDFIDMSSILRTDWNSKYSCMLSTPMYRH